MAKQNAVNRLLQIGNHTPLMHAGVCADRFGFRGDGVIQHFWELVEHHRINFFSGVPTVYAALMQQPTQGYDLSSLEYGLCGAAPMPVELMRAFQELTGLKIAPPKQ